MYSITDHLWITQFRTCPVCGGPFKITRVAGDNVYRRPFVNVGCEKLFDSLDGGITYPHHYGATVFHDDDYIVFRRIMFAGIIFTVVSSCIKRSPLTTFYSGQKQLHTTRLETYHRLPDSHLLSILRKLPNEL